MTAAKIVVLCVVSWLAGLSSYCFVWFRLEGRITGELGSVALWTAIAIVPFLMFYAVAVSILNQSPERKGALSYGVVCALIGVLPIVLLNLLFGGFDLRLLSPESLLFFAHFGTAGFTFGVLYAVFLRSSLPEQRQESR